MTRARIALVAAAAWIGQGAAAAVAQELPLPVALRRGPIMVRAERGLERVAARAADRAGPALAAIAEDLPDLPIPRSVEIRLVQRAEDLPRVAPSGRGVPPWAIGVAYPEEGVVVVAYRRGPMPSDVESTVAHELGHMALAAALGDRAPRWLHEGFAYLHSSDFSIDRSATLTGMAWTDDVIPLSELERSMPAAENLAGRAYAESYDFVAFLARRGRTSATDDDGNPWPFRRFLAEIAAGAAPPEAARRAFHAELATLFDEWRGSLRDRYLLMPVGLLGIAIWAAAAVLLVLAFRRKRREGRATLARWEAEERAADRSTDEPR